jgi:hypothetical protein
MDTSSLYKPVSFFKRSNYFRNGYSFIFDFKGNGLIQHSESYNCFGDTKEDFEKDNKIFKSRTVKSLLKIKKKSNIIFYAPFKIKTTISKNCWVGNEISEFEDKTEYFANFNYFPATPFLKLEMKDSIRLMGFEIYDKPITSNKIPIKL